MGLELAYIDGQTPVAEEEKDGLLIPTIATRGELDEFEQQNIEQAVQWTLGRSFKPETVFTEEFIRMVHKRMYADVWAWAGEFRKPTKTLVQTNGKYPLSCGTCWMTTAIGTKIIPTHPMKLPCGSNTEL